jgi:hypothetical protein
MRIIVYFVNLSLTSEGNKTDLKVIDDPNTSDGITIGPDGRLG